MKASAIVVFFCMACAVFVPGMFAAEAEPEQPAYSYAIAVSKATYNDPEWRKVADALEKKYDAAILQWDADVEETKDRLAEMMPTYTAFVARPEEAGHSFVVTISRMCRALDDDPYVDTFWGIITGYSAEDAMRIVSMEEPLIVTRVLDATGKIDLNAFDQGVCFDEFERDVVNEKFSGKPAVKRSCDNDDTQEFIAAMERLNPQLIATSAHATERDWQMGYKGPNMKMDNEDGQLFCIDTAESRFAMTNDEPKIYIGAGNCLIGDIDEPDCMATSWMHSGGACQFIGYTVPTWFGEMGWGTLDKFASQGGVYTAAEAFHFNNTEIIRTIESAYPQHVKTDIENYDADMDGDDIYRTLNVKRSDPGAGDLIGRLYDRDVVAFFGDPAFDVRANPSITVSTGRLEGGAHTGDWQIKIDAVADGAWSDKGETYFALPHTMKSVEVVDTDLKGDITYADNFILIALQGKYKKGDSFKIILREGL